MAERLPRDGSEKLAAFDQHSGRFCSPSPIECLAALRMPKTWFRRPLSDGCRLLLTKSNRRGHFWSPSSVGSASTTSNRLAFQREQYIGQWLPEPLITEPASDPVDTVQLDESLSMAFLALLERLNPTERAGGLHPS